MPPVILETAFNSYTLGDQLGEGGAGRVYAASDSAGQPVAVKFLHNATTDKRRRFKNEIHFLEKNSHPNLVKVLGHGAGTIGSTQGIFYVMPQYDASLREFIGHVDPDKAFKCFSAILDGVEAAHLKGVTHRDLKPENILVLRTTFSPVVADFGVARFREEELVTAVETRPGQRLANFQYAAPEQRARGGEADHRADIYALGLMLNELFTGTVPHGTQYAQIGSVAPAFAFLDPLVEEMIRQDPARRPPSVAKVKETILKYRTEAISLQKISQIDATVIPAGDVDDPLAFEPPRVIGGEWRDGYLFLRLDRPVNSGWIDALRYHMGGHTAVMGAGPERFEFNGTEARVPINDYSAQQAINHFKEWLPRASAAYRQILTTALERQRREREEELRRERVREEQRLQINRALQF